MLNFLFKNTKTDNNNWNFIQTDIHSHILPGIDDGAPKIEDSLALIDAMRKNGFKKMVATPHVSEDLYPNTKEKILEQRDFVRQKVLGFNWDIEIDAAAEYMIDEGFIALTESKEKLLAISDNIVLVEMSYLVESPFLNNALFAMQVHGYQPLLAHPERYNFYHHHLEKYDELKERGCLFQLNTIALSGYYGKGVKKTAEYLLSKNMYDYCGSDIHHLRHVKALNSILEMKAFQQIQQYPFLNNALYLSRNAV
ncbi:tyrosine-protein phosphatase [Arachidicoccus soli]|uniref:tyrosine-protein phosphatase n=1 Tax=Arachidicoccus soli TaxID=2341117 RepID=UPI0019690EAC|nr:CpsB/CapC family capsule biosynthesis tyrosine phosphatase [Arachidicoccus soli]